MTSPTVAVCIPTYKRPEGLTNLLESIRDIESGEFRVHVIIADNDPEGSAKPTIESFENSLPYPVTYVVESSRGLASVRNRLVSEALTLGAEFLAFADDDQTVDSAWLTSACDLMMSAHADVVVCNVKHVFPEHTASHIRSCFREWNYQTGTRIYRANTGGTMYRLSRLQQVPGPFDTRLNLTGGEDSLLAKALLKLGSRIYFSADAIVYEHVPSSRCTPEWIIKRAYRVGTTRGKIARWVDPSLNSVMKGAVVSGGLIVVSIVQLLYFLIVDRTQLLNRTRKIANGLGGLVALVSTKASPAEYAETHGE